MVSHLKPNQSMLVSHKVPYLGPHCSCFINDLPSHILNSLVNIYADDTSLYRCTSSDVDDHTAAADLSSDLEQVVQWGKDWFVTFNASKTKARIIP